MIARGTRGFFYASGIFTEVGILKVWDDERDCLGTSGAQSLGAGIGLIAQFFNRS
jgi:hypothetical protein